MVSEVRQWASPMDFLTQVRPDVPVLFFDPGVLQRTAKRFLQRFPGMVTYAVKANPAPEILDNLVAAGVRAFDVASPAEMTAVRRALPAARLHYHNPVRSRTEIAMAREHGIASWSVDRQAEYDKLADLPAGSEIAVRLKLPVSGAAYDFGTKFGATPDEAVALLRATRARGHVPAMTFHPGTQCADGAPWARYIAVCAEVAQAAGVRLARLNVGGGFAAHRSGIAPDLEAVFAEISGATATAFGAMPPPLCCEPGRAMVAEAVQLALRIKALDPESVTLNDGVYGALGEWRDLPAGDRIAVFAPTGQRRSGALRERVVFGPTCDSVDRLPHPLPLPRDSAEDDYLLFDAMGAYAQALVTGFNGYGARRVVTLNGAPSSG